jgi:mannose-1-phosphate guanylyltransferase/phosphomannomutase
VKAIVMAGGEGTRLRPISSNRPKPMVTLIDRPVLGHIFELLKRNGITDVCMTLRYLPHMITEYFGSGEEYGLNLTAHVEQEALGTAGGVKACVDFIGDETCLIISGDCVCDFDLKRCIAFHNEKKADATLVLYQHPDPLEYGLVVTDKTGRITGFLEKPAWNRVVTNRINTGIYILSPRVLAEIPNEMAYDFGKDLFPKMLAEGKKLYGVDGEGYWCDIGCSTAYLRCCMDILDGNVHIRLPAPEVQSGVFSESDIPEGVSVVPPVYIGKNVTLEQGAKIGPYAVLGRDTYVGTGTVVDNSVINGGFLRKNVTANSTVVCAGASVCSGAILCEGSIVGEGSVIGENCLIMPKIKIWPEKMVPAGMKVRNNLTDGMQKEPPVFGAGGVLSGQAGVTVTPEYCISVGTACAGLGKTGVSWSGGEAARLLAQALLCGVQAAGGRAVLHDSHFEWCAAYAAQRLGLAVNIFVRQTDENIQMYFTGPGGRPIQRDMERKIEAMSAETKRADAYGIGSRSEVTGMGEIYAAGAAEGIQCRGLRVSVTGTGNENRALRSALEAAGCEITGKKRGIPAFEVTEDLVLRAIDESGRYIDSGHLFVMAALAEFSQGSGELAVSYDAPAVLDLLASDCGGKLLRIGRDGRAADELAVRQVFMRDGIFAAVKICGYMATENESLETVCSKVPDFFLAESGIAVRRGRGAVMRELTDGCTEMAAELVSGLMIDTDRGRVHIAPDFNGDILRIKSESFDAETAEELCTEFRRRIESIDNRT